MVFGKSNNVLSINAAALLLGAASLLSRILGILRDRLLASHFGASRELDIYYAAFQVPDFVYNIFLLGAASTAIIPIFLEIRDKNDPEAARLINNLINVFVVIALAVVILASLFMPFFIKLVTPGFSFEDQKTTVLLARLMMLSPLFLGLSGILSAVTQIFRRFLVFALSPIVYNLGIILGIIVFLPTFGLAGLAFGVVIGAFLHMFVQFSSFWKLGFRLTPFWPRGLEGPVKRVVMLSFPRVVAASINSLTAVFLVALSSTLLGGSIAVYQFANNLGGLPIGIFGVSFAIASFPALSEHFLHKKARSFFHTFYSSISSILLWVFPLSVFFYVLRAQIVRLTLGAGRFDWNDTKLTAAALGIMTLAVFAHSLTPIFIRFFYALGNTLRPLLINVFTAVLTVILAFFFIGALNGQGAFSKIITKTLRVENIEGVAVLGVILAISVGALADLVLLSWAASAEAKKKWSVRVYNENKMSWGEIWKMLLAALGAGGICYLMLRVANIWVSLENFTGVFAQATVAFVFGMFAYGLILYYWNNEEVVKLAEMLRKKMVRLKVLPSSLEGGGIK